jgi:hypothetical protein
VKWYYERTIVFIVLMSVFPKGACDETWLF